MANEEPKHIFVFKQTKLILKEQKMKLQSGDSVVKWLLEQFLEPTQEIGTLGSYTASESPSVEYPIIS